MTEHLLGEYWLRVTYSGEHREEMTDMERRDPYRASRNLIEPALAVRLIDIDGELFEETRTRDVGHRKIDVNVVKPLGRGWSLHDASNDKVTVWRRRFRR
jgi:hypothetical protein